MLLRWLMMIGAIGCRANGAPSTPGVTAQVVVDATHDDGTLHIEMRWRGLSGHEQSFRALGGDAFTYSDVQISSAAGLLPHRRERGSYRVEAPGEVKIRYRVRPGGSGRHGLQGAVASDWVITDGRVFMIPHGGVDPARIDLSFVLPKGWVVASPFTPDGSGYVLEGHGALSADQQLEAACFGLGRFEASQGQGYTSWSYLGWPAEYRAELAAGTGKMVHWFRDQVALEAPYTAVWTPMVDGQRVFGGSSGSGSCFEFPPEKPPKETRRNWQLLGHRIAHTQNRYPPGGMRILDQRDHWFVEGWAAYAEILSTEAVGLGWDRSWGGSYLDLLWERHLRIRTQKPDWAYALKNEAKVGEEVHEYLHYTLSPLVVAHLDFWMQERSGKTVLQFVRWLNAKHGRFQGSVALRDELRAFTGHDYSDFFALYVDRPVAMFPNWVSALGEEPERVATVSGAGIDAGLLRAAATGSRFERYGALRDWLVQVERRMADLDRRELSLAPRPLIQERHRLPGPAHLALLEMANAYPMEFAPAPRSRGCWGPEALPPAGFRANTNSAMGLRFEALLAAEENQVLVGAERVAVRFLGDRPEETLVVGDEEDLQLMVKWITPPGQIEVELLQDGEQVALKTLVLEPTWMRTWSTFRATVRKPGESVLTFRVRDSNGLRVSKSIWQVPGKVR